MENNKDEELLKGYLLGGVSQDQQDVIQERLLDDPDFLNQLLVIENGLIEDYALGNLPVEQAELFERHFLQSPDRIHRLKVARQLKEYVSDKEKSPSIADRLPPRFSRKWMALMPRTIVAAAVLVLAALLLWLLRDREILKGQIKESQARQDSRRQEDLRDALQSLNDKQAENSALKQQVQDEQRRADELQAQINSLREEQLSSRKHLNARQRNVSKDNGQQLLAELDPQPLRPGLERGTGAPNSVRIRSAARQVLLQLILEDDKYPNYRVELRDAGNRLLTSKSGLKSGETSSGKSLMVSLRTKVFTTGDYFIIVRGAGPAGQLTRVDSYQFRVQVE
jgi:DNA repair exonuclease SbcCD ATPase subunit